MLIPDLAVHDAVCARLRGASLPPHLVVHVPAEVTGAMEEWDTEEEIETAAKIGLCIRWQESRAGDAHGLHGSTGKEIVGDDGGGEGEDQFDRRFWALLYAALGPNGKTILFCPPIESCLKAQLIRRNFLFFKALLPTADLAFVMRCAVAAYNAGTGGVKKGLDESKDPDLYTKDHKYSAQVLGYRDQFFPA